MPSDHADTMPWTMPIEGECLVWGQVPCRYSRADFTQSRHPVVLRGPTCNGIRLASREGECLAGEGVLTDGAWLLSEVLCEDRLGTGPPRARTHAIYVDVGILACRHLYQYLLDDSYLPPHM